MVNKFADIANLLIYPIDFRRRFPTLVDAMVQRVEAPWSRESEAVSDLQTLNAQFEGQRPELLLDWAQRCFGDELILSTSFGADSALMLHLVSQHVPNIRVVFIDTGYLFPETYRFAEQLTARFGLDVRVYSPLITPARQEALYGRLWQGTAQDLERYHYLNKVEPMDRALRELAPRAWISGVRRHQTAFRNQLRPVEPHQQQLKLHPILHWTPEDVRRYMSEHQLPYHPLFDQGYRSIGDVHSTRPTSADQDPRSGRLLGEHRECGIHLPRAAQLPAAPSPAPAAPIR